MKRLLLFVFVAMMGFVMVSCGSGKKAGTQKHRIGVLAPAVTHGWVAAVAFYAEKRCMELNDQIEYKILTSSSGDEMTSQLDELLAWNADAIVAFPQWTGMDVPLGRAIKDGVKVVMFDIAIEADGVYLVSGDNESMGVGSAEYLIDKLGPDATVAVLEVPTSGSVSALRLKGFMDTMNAKAPNMKLLKYATKFTREDGLKDFADILTANPKIDGVFSMDDETSIGVLQAIKEAGRTDIKVVTGGGGCKDYFKLMPQYQDIMVQSALYSPSMVMTAVDVAVDLANGKAREQKIVIPTTIVDRTNYTEYLNEDSPY